MPVSFQALIVTIVVEYFIYLLFIRSKPLFLLFTAVIINCITQPPAYIAYNYFIESSLNFSKAAYFIIIEVAVFVIEIFLIKLLMRVSLFKSVIISFAANITTALLSFL